MKVLPIDNDFIFAQFFDSCVHAFLYIYDLVYQALPRTYPRTQRTARNFSTEYNKPLLGTVVFFLLHLFSPATSFK